MANEQELEALAQLATTIAGDALLSVRQATNPHRAAYEMGKHDAYTAMATGIRQGLQRRREQGE